MLTRIKVWLKSDFSLSTVALWLGWFSLIAGISQIAQKPKSDTDTAFIGLIILLGVYANRSAKRRKLGIKKNTWFRKTAEFLLLIIMVAAILLQRDFVNQIQDNPISGIIAPIWALTAYILVLLKKHPKEQINEG